jgi:hypothetical protein
VSEVTDWTTWVSREETRVFDWRQTYPLAEKYWVKAVPNPVTVLEAGEYATIPGRTPEVVRDATNTSAVSVYWFPDRILVRDAMEPNVAVEYDRMCPMVLDVALAAGSAGNP